ncbi:hypothetical protein HMN09_00941800 [Mycena chlorophos]|uniref:Uncharacterized protein n=1 Tax=Mycena chlorophos TaxID=658473 RepID=A0A8H6W031_MYCCL|nr:hypothetical protein HMN09_00941800 [Mycena chlorophos]
MGSAAVTNAFYGMQAAGLLGAFIMLLTAMIWHRTARRHASWFSFMVAWLISCASYLLTMSVPEDQEPNHALCLFQASLIYAVPVLTSAATISLVVNIYLNLRALLTGSRNYSRATVTAALIIVPYIPAWAVFTIALKIGLGTDHNAVVGRHQGNGYCSLVNDVHPTQVSSAFVAALMIVCLGIEIVIIRAMRRAWETLQRDDRGSITIAVRVLAFTLVGMLSIILSLVLLALPYEQNNAFNIVIATIPLSSVLIFGSQADFLAAWASIFYFFLGRRRRTDHVHGSDTFAPSESQQALRTPEPRTPTCPGYFAIPPATHDHSSIPRQQPPMLPSAEQVAAEEHRRREAALDEAWAARRLREEEDRKRRHALEAAEVLKGEMAWVASGGILRDANYERDYVRTEAMRKEIALLAREKELMERWEKYEAGWAALNGAVVVRFADIPWPATARPDSDFDYVTLDDLATDRIRAFLLEPLTVRGSTVTKKERVRASLLRWHPDKLAGLLSRVADDEMDVVREGVHRVVLALQNLNSSLQ